MMKADGIQEHQIEFVVGSEMGDKVRHKIEKLQKESAGVELQWQHYIKTGRVPCEQAFEMTEEALDAIGVLWCAVQLTAANLLAAREAQAQNSGLIIDNAQCESERTISSLAEALKRFQESDLVNYLPDFPAKIMQHACNLPIAATDPNAANIHATNLANSAANGSSVLPGSPSLQRMIGYLIVLGESATNEEAKAEANACLDEQLFPLYDHLRAAATRIIVPRILDDVAAYNIVTATKLSEPGAAAAIEEIEAHHLLILMAWPAGQLQTPEY
jgi:hypothetical protein